MFAPRGFVAPKCFAFSRSERGVALTELVLIIPLLIFIITGIIDLGFALRNAQIVANAARHGAEEAALASVNPDVAHPLTCEYLQDTAKQKTIEYLSNAGLSESEWDVTAVIGNDESTASTDHPFWGFTFGRVQIALKEGKSLCLLCYKDTLLGAISLPAVGSQAYFRMKQICAM